MSRNDFFLLVLRRSKIFWLSECQIGKKSDLFLEEEVGQNFWKRFPKSGVYRSDFSGHPSFFLAGISKNFSKLLENRDRWKISLILFVLLFRPISRRKMEKPMPAGVLRCSAGGLVSEWSRRAERKSTDIFMIFSRWNVTHWNKSIFVSNITCPYLVPPIE